MAMELSGAERRSNVPRSSLQETSVCTAGRGGESVQGRGWTGNLAFPPFFFSFFLSGGQMHRGAQSNIIGLISFWPPTDPWVHFSLARPNRASCSALCCLVWRQEEQAKRRGNLTGVGIESCHQTRQNERFVRLPGLQPPRERRSRLVFMEKSSAFAPFILGAPESLGRK